MNVDNYISQLSNHFPVVLCVGQLKALGLLGRLQVSYLNVCRALRAKREPFCNPSYHQVIAAS